MEKLQRGKWKAIKELGRGGQGVVYLSANTEKVNPEKFGNSMRWLVNQANYQMYPDYMEQHFQQFIDSIKSFIDEDNPDNYGALKVLHKPQDNEEWKLAQNRIKREIEIMRKLNHPNSMKIIDVDSSENPEWFVSQYYPNGTLDKNKQSFTGDLLSSLKAFRFIVEAVAELHKKGVHRDIKPENVFIGHDNQLILGDFGLIFFDDDIHSRLSGTLENVGSRDWMPIWAYGIRVEDMTPVFDVFSLGKSLWAMISKEPKLLGWYFNDTHHPEYNLEKMFPDKSEMKFVNKLFEKCITEHKEDCKFSNASALLKEVDKVILECQADFQIKNISQKCKMCGVGTYQLSNIAGEELKILSSSPNGSQKLRVFKCGRCGNVQMFDKNPEGWK